MRDQHAAQMLSRRVCSVGLQQFFAQPASSDCSSHLYYGLAQHSTSHDPILLREHLFEHLSGEVFSALCRTAVEIVQSSGYFSSHYSPIGVLKEPIEFNFLLGESGWRAKQQQIYSQLQRAWLTPVELFQPWYAQAVARYIVRDHQQRRPHHHLSIVEVGGGHGTMAAGILDYLSERHAQMYRTMRYTALDASPSLVESQQQRLQVHSHQFRAFAGDARDTSTWHHCPQDRTVLLSAQVQEPLGSCYVSRLERLVDVIEVYSYVLAFEVLDNLPHDCVVKREGSDEWLEVTVQHEASMPGSFHLSERPLQDPLIHKVLMSAQWNKAGNKAQSEGMLSRLWDAIAGVPPPYTSSQPSGSFSSGTSQTFEQAQTSEKLFLPTGCMQLLKSLHTALPQHHLIAADFAHFAPADIKISGLNAPIISHTEKGKSVDHDSLLVPTGSADIFFPTNFEAATQLWMSFRRADIASSQPYGFRASVQPSAVFMNTYGNTRKTKTMTAYNPLLDDFENTSFILADTCCKT